MLALFSLRLVGWSYICLKEFQYTVWFLQVICEGICAHAGWSRCFMVDINTCSSSDVVGRPAFHLTFMCSVPGRKTNTSTALKTQKARHTQHKTSCNMQTASAQHGKAQAPCNTGCIQVREATCGPADLDLTWMTDAELLKFNSNCLLLIWSNKVVQNN